MRSISEWKKRPSNALAFIRKVENKIRSIAPEAEVILYGSRAKGIAQKDSDWDFLILTRQIVNQKLVDNLRDNLYEIELESSELISSIIRSKEEWESPKYDALPFKEIVTREGILL